MTEKEDEIKEINDTDEQDERFKDDPEAEYRIYSVLSYFFVLVILGLPVWWHTTRVYRAPLPINEMTNVEIPAKTIRENSIPLSLEYDVLITMVNPDPQNLKFDLNAKDLIVNLQPFLQNIEGIANFTIKSQWLYMTDLGVTPRAHGDHLALHEEQLPHIITPLEKKIWSHMSPRPCLNLVVYATPCHTKLYMYNKDQNIIARNSFLSPRWGGITILNPDSKSCETRIFKPDLRFIIDTFYIQLRELIGLKSDAPDDVKALKKVKAREMVDSTRRTLKSLAQLLSEINSIVISQEVADKIEIALHSANEAEEYLKQNRIDRAIHAAKISYKNSEDAFSDPSLLALLYFPDDQKYAVYIPLFLPIMIPVIMSLNSVRKFYFKKDKIIEKVD